MTNYVQNFTVGRSAERALLGGKGADLAEMVGLGLPVPPGFTITTEACRHYLKHGAPPPELDGQVARHLAELETAAGRRFGDPDDPLLVSVRSGAAISMPGMMDTVLDIGLNDTTVLGLAARTGDERFAFDSYRRLVQMFGDTVLGVPSEKYSEALDELEQELGVHRDVDLPADALRRLVERFQEITAAHGDRPFPQDPREQLDLAVRAVFGSWLGERARLYRRHQGIPDDLGTAVNVQMMVFGNLGSRSGSGVAFTRDPATGRLGPYGDYLPDAQGEDVVSGVRDTVPLADLEQIDEAAYRRLRSLMGTLERHYRDMCDIEFTIEEGRLWMLQTRIGKRTPAAAFQIAADLVEEGAIDLDEALRRVSGDQLAHLLHPGFDPSTPRTELTHGVAASPGAAVGRVVFDSATAADWAVRGETVVLVRRETRPEDLPGMLVAAAILTARGGKTSHAAVVARGLGRPCVCGAGDLEVDPDARRMRVHGGAVVDEGDVISVDGATGEVFLGAVPVVESEVARWFDGQPVTSDLVDAVALLVRHADEVRALGVRVNADNASDAARAVRFGAEGIGLCRTEHMFLGERRRLVERLILAETDPEREAALAELLPLQRADFTELFAAIGDRPVTVRLIDPPLHEFLPDVGELLVRIGRHLDETTREGTTEDERLLAAVERMHEDNPMLGLRGVRLAIAIPGLVAMQTRAILEAADDHRVAGGTVEPEIMVPLVASAAELELVRAEIERVGDAVAAERGRSVPYRIGAMVELPRAALTADRIADHAEFLSFGTNDLTQTTWGLSRDDAEASVVRRYLDLGLLSRSPFETIDVDGVGALVRTAAERARDARPGIGLGVCGEHGGDPTSIAFFAEIGLDYVSCSPYRVPVARLEAGRATVLRHEAVTRMVAAG
ncbi:MAG TPA: pyruvate, phosphate dikinase [Nocardioides sp.]|nr:pyruvate, phosphate dikinase [Nocardioides sp.]